MSFDSMSMRKVLVVSLLALWGCSQPGSGGSDGAPDAGADAAVVDSVSPDALTVPDQSLPDAPLEASTPDSAAEDGTGGMDAPEASAPGDGAVDSADASAEAGPPSDAPADAVLDASSDASVDAAPADAPLEAAADSGAGDAAPDAVVDSGAPDAGRYSDGIGTLVVSCNVTLFASMTIQMTFASPVPVTLTGQLLGLGGAGFTPVATFVPTVAAGATAATLTARLPNTSFLTAPLIVTMNRPDGSHFWQINLTCP